MVDSINGITRGLAFNTVSYSPSETQTSNVSSKDFLKNEDQAILKEDLDSFTAQNLDTSNIKSELDNLLNEENLTMQFSKDSDTQKMIVRLVDNDTEEIVKQFPPEISLQIAKMVSNILDSKI